MNKKPELSESAQSMLADLRQTLNPETPAVSEGDTEVLDTTHVTAVVDTDWRAAESETVTEVFDAAPVDTTVLPVDGDTEAFTTELPAEEPVTEPIPPSEPIPPAQPVPPTNFGTGPTPTWTAPAPAAMATKNHPVRVGLLVWSGILIIAGLMLVANLLFPFTTGRFLLIILLAAFGLILVIAAIASGVRNSRTQHTPR